MATKEVVLRKPTYVELEKEVERLQLASANLHMCATMASVALRNAGLYPYPWGKEVGMSNG